MPRPITQLRISGTQERWFIQTSSQPETTESVYRENTIQNGEPGYDKRPVEKQRLDGLHRPEGCIPFSSNLGGSPEIPPLPTAGQGVRVSVSSLWPVQCIHQAAETSVDASMLSKNTTYNVPGR